eukprot:4856058-Lingulodinium_polyedra.AAC.1
MTQRWGRQPTDDGGFRNPPVWSLGNESPLSCRAWVEDLKAWLQRADLQPPQQAADICDMKASVSWLPICSRPPT